jgi:hypothetical protein
MISPWAALLFAALGIGVLGVGLYLLAWHRGYSRGLGERIGRLPGDAWKPSSSEEFMAELLDRERKNEPPRKYQREK